MLGGKTGYTPISYRGVWVAVTALGCHAAPGHSMQKPLEPQPAPKASSKVRQLAADSHKYTLVFELTFEVGLVQEHAVEHLVSGEFT